jgi:hypothetical protein
LSFQLIAIVFFTVLLAAFYAIAYSVVAGIFENYIRYYQKAELQWTGPSGTRHKKNRLLNIIILLAVSFVSAWLIVKFMVLA